MCLCVRQDYFPPRRGDETFTQVVAELRQAGVYTFPYINGRIFDTQSASFEQEDGNASVVMMPAEPTMPSSPSSAALRPPTVLGATNHTTWQPQKWVNLAPCQSFYGSVELDGSPIYFDIADPTTAYWQNKYAKTVGRLVHTNGVAGVYLDQLCASSPAADWSHTNLHSAGGGDWWRRGMDNAELEVKKTCVFTAKKIMSTSTLADP